MCHPLLCVLCATLLVIAYSRILLFFHSQKHTLPSASPDASMLYTTNSKNIQIAQVLYEYIAQVLYVYIARESILTSMWYLFGMFIYM